MYFKGSSECIVCFTNFDTRYMLFDRISNWSNCRSSFCEGHVTLVKLLVFSKYIFRAIVQIPFQGSSDWFIGFATYDTRYLYILWNIELKL